MLLDQITGYRKDRLGARIIALGNLLRMETEFGVRVRYLWPDAFEDHDMTVADTDHPIFAPDFLDRYIDQIPAGTKPDFDGLTDIDAIRGKVSSVTFQDRLHTGERFLCAEGLHPVLFSNEIGPKHAASFRTALARISFSPAVQAVLDQAAAKLAQMGGTPQALHVRRGDVLDKAPWCHKNWIAKFAPDEFYTATMDLPDTSSVLFSDTPVVVSRMAQGRHNAIPLEDLINAPDLSEMQRDLVELLLMARCTQIVAPSLSAFSTSAAMMSGSSVSKLPAGLPAAPRKRAYDALLDRVLDGPASFHNTGDFAQSIGYAFGHALKKNQHAALYKRLCDSIAQGQDFASYIPLTMALALSCGQTDHALDLHKRARTDPNIWADDLMICDALGAVAAHSAGQTDRGYVDFLRQYLARKKTVLNLDSLANYFVTMEPRMRDLFMIDDITRQTFDTPRIFMFPADDALFQGALHRSYPFWLVRADWVELFDQPRLLGNITKDPDLMIKQRSLPGEIRLAERAFFRGEGALPDDVNAVRLLSVLAVAFTLSGRYKRATQILFHCRKHMPRDPMILKRLANRFIASGHLDNAARNLDRALKYAPGHPGLLVARAQVMQDKGDHTGVATLLADHADQGFLPLNYYKVWEKSLKQLKSGKAARAVIARAATQHPGHPIFDNRWADKT
jgi:hypothetical protein